MEYKIILTEDNIKFFDKNVIKNDLEDLFKSLQTLYDKNLDVYFIDYQEDLCFKYNFKRKDIDVDWSILSNKNLLNKYFNDLTVFVPSILYHKSNPINRNNILTEGLIPKIGYSYEAHYEDFDVKPAVFLSETKDYDTTYDDDLFEIESSNYSFIKDPDVKNGYVCFEKINPNNIKLIYKGTGDDLL